jgi:hypothetical protein
VSERRRPPGGGRPPVEEGLEKFLSFRVTERENAGIRRLAELRATRLTMLLRQLVMDELALARQDGELT